MLIPCKMSRNPVQNHPDSSLMALVHKILEISGSAVPAGNCKVAGYLITPGRIVGMFSDWHQLYMGKAGFFQPGNQLVGQFTVAQKSRILIHFPAPGTRMNFIK